MEILQHDKLRRPTVTGTTITSRSVPSSGVAERRRTSKDSEDPSPRHPGPGNDRDVSPEVAGTSREGTVDRRGRRRPERARPGNEYRNVTSWCKAKEVCTRYGRVVPGRTRAQKS